MKPVTINDFIAAFNYADTASLIHVVSEAIRQGISLKNAYDNLGAVIDPIHDSEDQAMLAEIQDVEDPRKLNNLIVISVLRLENMMKVIYS